MGKGMMEDMKSNFAPDIEQMLARIQTFHGRSLDDAEDEEYGNLVQSFKDRDDTPDFPEVVEEIYRLMGRQMALLQLAAMTSIKWNVGDRPVHRMALSEFADRMSSADSLILLVMNLGGERA